MAKGLIIKPVWLDKIFEQGKCWEMRSSMTKHRGKTYLIASGSGVITGECNIVDAFPITENDAMLNKKCHQVDDLSLLKKWRFAWVLKDVVKYNTPIPYTHPQGAVIWVNLTNGIVSQV